MQIKKMLSGKLEFNLLQTETSKILFSSAALGKTSSHIKKYNLK